MPLPVFKNFEHISPRQPKPLKQGPNEMEYISRFPENAIETGLELFDLRDRLWISQFR